MNPALIAVATLAAMCCCSLALAEIKKTDVEYKQGDVTLKGVMMVDDQYKEKRPGVVIFPEWWGLTDYPKMRAEKLAKLGYVAFAADLYGDGKTTEDPRQAGEWAGALRKDQATLVARAQAALDELKKNDLVDKDKTAAIGYCFGGTTALGLAMNGADLSGVAVFHAGLDLPLDNVKNIKCKVLICNGGDDKMVTPEQVEALKKAFRDNKIDWEFNDYGGALHAFTNPKADKFNIPAIAYNKQADRRSWSDLTSFFKEIFNQPHTHVFQKDNEKGNE
ncbi:MAG TPA: dienelactone hydrolase family protein [Tepidisphaeraceae bacterium]|jgi:dienelactone hydrolase